jgi:hypothetical protein
VPRQDILFGGPAVSDHVRGVYELEDSDAPPGYGSRSIRSKSLLMSSSTSMFSAPTSSMSSDDVCTDSADLKATNCAYTSSIDVRSSEKPSSMEDSMDMTYFAEREYGFAPQAEVGIGAGASIEQSIVKDRRDLSVWEDEPGAVIRLYFVFQDEFESYVSHGLKDLSGAPEGFLKDLPKGGSDE